MIKAFLLILTSALFISASEHLNKIEQKFIKAGLIDVHTIDSTIKVDLVNAHKRKNYFREDFYDGLNKAYLNREVAKKLSKAQKILKKKHPEYSLLILDAARPRSVSRKMYNKMKGTKFEKYVANPKKGSMHNYGIAVDITMVKGKKELDMGFSPFRKGRIELLWIFLLKKMGKKLNKTQKSNRVLLKRTMLKAGFYPLSFEWWHFNGMKKDVARRTLKIIE